MIHLISESACWVWFLNSNLQVFKECHLYDNSGNSFELALISCKCIGAYVRNKKNQNQVFLLMTFCHRDDSFNTFALLLDARISAMCWLHSVQTTLIRIAPNIEIHLIEEINENKNISCLVFVLFVLVRFAGFGKKSGQMMTGGFRSFWTQSNTKAMAYCGMSASLERDMWALEGSVCFRGCNLPSILLAFIEQ